MSRKLQAPASERVRVVEHLGQASRLNFLGNFEDGPLIWALVLLLNDDNQQVREAAFAVLEKQVGDSFGYQPALPAAERKTTVEKWQAWCKEKCGPLPE